MGNEIISRRLFYSRASSDGECPFIIPLSKRISLENKFPLLSLELVFAFKATKKAGNNSPDLLVFRQFLVEFWMFELTPDKIVAILVSWSCST